MANPFAHHVNTAIDPNLQMPNHAEGPAGNHPDREQWLPARREPYHKNPIARVTRVRSFESVELARRRQRARAAQKKAGLPDGTPFVLARKPKYKRGCITHSILTHHQTKL